MRQQAGNWIPIVALALMALALPAVTNADLVCPSCEPAPNLGLREVVLIVVASVLQEGVAVLLLGVTAVAGVPWLVAGVALVAFYSPRWLRALF